MIATDHVEERSNKQSNQYNIYFAFILIDVFSSSMCEFIRRHVLIINWLLALVDSAHRSSTTAEEVVHSHYLVSELPTSRLLWLFLTWSRLLESEFNQVNGREGQKIKTRRRRKVISS
jgi:hypothetical protein